MKSRRRAFAFGLAAVLALTLAVSFFCLILCAGHDCDGVCCPVCGVIARAESLLRGIGLLAAAAAACASALCIHRACCACAERAAVPESTPVRLRVRLND